jgi:hypothetical protein
MERYTCVWDACKYKPPFNSENSLKGHINKVHGGVVHPPMNLECLEPGVSLDTRKNSLDTRTLTSPESRPRR